MGGATSKCLIERWGISSSCTVVTLEPSIVYAGLGLGSINFDDLLLTRVLPKFFIQRVKSADDIEVRLSVITNWLRENSDILQSLIQLQKAAIKRSIP